MNKLPDEKIKIVAILSEGGEVRPIFDLIDRGRSMLVEAKHRGWVSECAEIPISTKFELARINRHLQTLDKPFHHLKLQYVWRDSP